MDVESGVSVLHPTSLFLGATQAGCGNFEEAALHDMSSKSVPLLRDLHFRSRALYEILEEKLPGGFGLQQRGLLMLCKTRNGLARRNLSTAKRAETFDVPTQDS